MTNNEGNRKHRVTDIVQCNAGSVGALRTIYKLSGIQYLGHFINLNYVKYENHLINFNINNVTNKIQLRAKIELQNEDDTLQNVSIVRQ